MKILFFLEGLNSGGKERRLIELISYLKRETNYEFHIVLTEPEIHYKYVLDFGIPITVLKRKLINKDPSLFFRFYLLCTKVKPDIIHSWATMTTFYAIPTVKILGKKLITNEIADAPPEGMITGFTKFKWLINKRFANIIIANSFAGLTSYGVKSNEGIVIYNGVRLERFETLISKEIIRKQIGIKTTFVVTMVASFSENKDYDTFLDIAEKIQKIRSDVSFVAVGGGQFLKKYVEKLKSSSVKNIFIIGRSENVESIINASDIGLLFTNKNVHGEGIPNVVIEFMALKKPVIATDAGGTKEILQDKKTGYLVDIDNKEYIFDCIQKLLKDKNLSSQMGNDGRRIVEQNFNVDKMGKEFLSVYQSFAEN